MGIPIKYMSKEEMETKWPDDAIKAARKEGAERMLKVLKNWMEPNEAKEVEGMDDSFLWELWENETNN